MVRYQDWTGERKQKCKRGFATKREAQEWERSFQMQTSGDLDMTFEAFTELYTKDMKPRLKENTWLTKENIIQKKILPYFGKRKISEITTKDVIAWQNELLAYRDEKRKPYSATYLKTLHNQLSAIFNHAVRFYELRSNPAAKAGNMGSEERKEMLFWTKAEYQKFADAMMDKSFLMAQLAYHVSMGLPLWGYPVHKGTVLYLALEDDHRRLQGRLYRMFGTEGTDNLLFAVYAKQLGVGLEEQLKKFVREHPNTKLIIIDTLQKIREAGGDKYSYANDYEVVGKLKRLADDCGVCLLLVHHTRKQQADDKFDMISGTNGLLGAADGAFLLQKEKRTDGSAVLDVAGRDQQDQRFYLTRDKERLIWTLERTETEAWTEPPDPVLEAIAALVTAEKPTWGGTATELVAALQTDMKPNALAMRLNVRAGKLLIDYHIRYENSRSHAGRSISLTLEPSQA